MNDATNPAPEAPVAAEPAKRAHPFVWLFMGVVMLICTGAGGAVYLEHRLAQYNAARERLDAQREQPDDTSATALRMLSSLQMRVKTLEAALTEATKTTQEYHSRLTTLENAPAPDITAMDTLTKQLANTDNKLTELADVVKKQAVPTAAYGAVLRSFLQLKQHIGTEQAAEELSAFEAALAAIAIEPKQLALRANIAENIGHINAALTHDLASRDALLSALRESAASIKPAPIEPVPQDVTEPTGFWDRLAAFSRRHVRIEPEAQAQARDAYDALMLAESRDDILGAARVVAALDNAPKALTHWQSRAKDYLTVTRALAHIEDDLTALTQGD